jgi:HSP20 family protein
MTAHTPAKDLVPSLQRNAMSVFAPLQREFNRFFDDLGEGFGALTETAFAPRMDVDETAAGLRITVEAPGLTGDQIKVTAEDDVLTISGEKTASQERVEGRTRHTERSFGRFSRSIYLPRSIDPAKISATMKDGVLTVDVPKRPDAEAKTIEIQSR